MLLRVLLLFVCLSYQTFAQHTFVVEEVYFTETVDHTSVSEIPRLKDKSNPANVNVKKINAYILDRFMLNDFALKAEDEFHWYDVKFDSEIKSNLLFIHFTGDYYGPYMSSVDEEMFFDLETGAFLTNHNIPFESLFTLQGYTDFLQARWLPNIKSIFKEAKDCAEQTEPYCSYYDFTAYTFDGHQVSIELTDDCYPHVLRACSPVYGITIAKDTIKTYLSSLGSKILFTDQYTSLKGIDRYLYNEKISAQLPTYFYSFGKIDGKYPFSMALELDKKNATAKGYYYYDKKMIKIKLEGQLSSSQIKLKESDKGMVTGAFDFTWSNEYHDDAYPYYQDNEEDQYLKASWNNAEQTKKLSVQLTKVQLTARHW